jgi:hypothetical protein
VNILFINSVIPNYVTDSLFHGLRSIPGVTVVDIPRLDFMYSNASVEDLCKTGSKGNTLYKLLDEPSNIRGKRTFWQSEIEGYDFIIFSDIFYQCDLFYYIYRTINPKRRNALCIVDGYDITAKFPFIYNSLNLKIRPWAYFANVGKVNYYKREYENSGELFGILKQRSSSLNKLFSYILRKPSNVFPISMSIPKEHIEYIPMKSRTQNFVNYNVDNSLADLFPARPVAELGKWQPAFENQHEYFEDIKKSRFGITAKRAGWDCLRHYEYAAKGAILCFKNLQQKSALCAPFGLEEKNCIIYNEKQDLLDKIRKKSLGELQDLQDNQYKWIQHYTTQNVASRFLDHLLKSKKKSKF